MSTPTTRLSLRLTALSALALTAAACTGDRFSLPGGSAPANEPAVARPTPPPVPMAGRWTLQSAGRACSMNFGQPAAPGAAEGTVAPAGGCPGQFFTTRKWSFDSSGLLLSNHNAEPLARLSVSGAAFSGNSTGGEPVTLSR